MPFKSLRFEKKLCHHHHRHHQIDYYHHHHDHCVSVKLLSRTTLLTALTNHQYPVKTARNDYVTNSHHHCYHISMIIIMIIRAA